MLRVYEHIYYSHISLLRHLNLLDQFQFSLCHFIFFVDQFNLVSSQNFRPLHDFLNQFAPNLRCFGIPKILTIRHQGAQRAAGSDGILLRPAEWLADRRPV